ncbi:MAG: hypothetical protein RMI49_02235 [Candidatus Caldarchaeum sp.]|nr:hypothetical protein [Candidatus Caldarchaeum sp.]
MSEAFVKAFKHVQDQISKNVSDAMIQEKMPEFRDGNFSVNRYLPYTPPLLGMALKSPVFQMSVENLAKVEKFAKRRGLLVKTVGNSVELVTKDGIRRAILRPDFFAASTPQLFESIGKVFYGLGQDTATELEVMDGFTSAVARILADKMNVTKAVVAIFLLFTPVLWLAASLFLTESLFYPRWALIAAGLAAIGVTAYIIRQYFRENFPELSERIDTTNLVRTTTQRTEEVKKQSS